METADPSPDRLVDRLRRSRRILALTGAGLSTESGIPDYRDEHGEWKRSPPVTYQEFRRSASARRRYWARSFLGWERFGGAAPNPGHRALARLEAAGRVAVLVTQNVDGLHQRAGSRRVVDLHVRLDAVICMECGAPFPRDDLQGELRSLNPTLERAASRMAPDGDADPLGVDYDSFRTADCVRCGGLLKPDVVFFGESVPRERVRLVHDHVAAADLILGAGSSFRTWSGYRFVRAAAERGVPIALVNLGRTRADEHADHIVRGSCGTLLPALVDAALAPGLSASPGTAD